jgi:hypothetical protein
MKVYSKFLIAIFSIAFLSGCAALPKSSVLFQHTPLLPKGTVEVKVGMDYLDDKRPDKEKKKMSHISDLSEQVTSVVCRDFRDAELFKSIKLGYNPDEVDIIIRGELRSFFWESGYSPTTFMPYLQFIHIFGVPAGTNKGRVEIYLQLVNAKTGEIISSYDEATDSKKSFSIYQSQSYRTSGGEETSDAFRIIVDQLRNDILLDREKILSSVVGD